MPTSAPVKLDLQSIETMAAAGATIDMILSVLRMRQAAADAEAETRRAQDKARKRRERLSEMSTGNGVTLQDNADGSQAIAGGVPAEAQGDVVDRSAENTAEYGKKERSPTPPKEKLSTPSLPFGEPLEEPRGTVDTRARRNERATRLPDDWVPSLADLAFAKTQLPDGQIAIETEKFRDYWHARAGPGAVKRSWSATWRNWCRKHVENGRSNGGGNGANRNGGNNGHSAGGHRGGFASYALNRARAAGEA
jgi:hypothetical protein